MSSLFEYNVKYTPDPISAKIEVDVSDGNELKATLSGVPDITFRLVPTGNFVQKVISAVLTPVADLIAFFCKSKPAEMLNGKSETIMTVGSYDVDGVTITPSNLALGSFTEGADDMLKITGDLTLTSN